MSDLHETFLKAKALEEDQDHEQRKCQDCKMRFDQCECSRRKRGALEWAQDFTGL